MTGTHPAPVFVIGDVAHVVEPILDTPVPAHEREDEFGGGLVGGKGGFARKPGTPATWVPHGQPKEVVVYPLVRDARAQPPRRCPQ